MALAAATAWLHQAGLDVRACDLAVDRLPADALDGVTLVAVSLPMHTATRLALPVVRALRQRAPGLPICAFGLYAPLNEERLRDEGVSLVLGPECETDLVTAARAAASPGARAEVAPGPAPRPRRQPRHSALGRRRRSADRARPHQAAVARSLRPAPVAGWPPGRRRRCRIHPRLQTSVPPLSHRAGLRGTLRRGARRHGARRHPLAGRAGRQPHHLRRPRLLQRPHPRDAHRGGPAPHLAGF